jgi:hypothetical protein
MSSRTKNWNRKPGHNSYMPKAMREKRREERRKRMEYRRKHGWTAQNVFASCYLREKIDEALKDADLKLR